MLFVFGTLLDPVTRARVLGHPLHPDDTMPAMVAGCERVYARGRHYPVLVRDPDGIVDGLLILRLSARERARLRVYEGSQYRVARIRVRPLRRGPPVKRPLVWAHVFVARGLGATARPWVPLGHHAGRVR